MNVPESLKILCVGNSFAVDTMQYVAQIALDLGVKNVCLGNLYVGGCSIDLHWKHACGDLPAYKYYTNDGTGWQSVENYKIRDAVLSQQWDWISIQHGSKNGSTYTNPERYANLEKLAAYVRQLAGPKTKIAFNMAWAGEPDLAMPEMISFGGDQLAMYCAMTRVTREVVQPTPGIDRVSPVGTAVQNARTAGIGLLTRDKFHLSYDVGRYIAGITFLKALTGMSVDGLNWAPDGVGDRVRQVAIESANNAVRCPYAVTPSEVPL